MPAAADEFALETIWVNANLILKEIDDPVAHYEKRYLRQSNRGACD
jgi:hypothetical protein